MKKLNLFNLFVFISFFCIPVFAETQLTKDEIHNEAVHILQGMSLKEKIGQKLMLDFRYWCSTKQKDNQPCIQDFISMNSVVKKIISQNHIGGIILFSNNLKDITQITTLTHAFQQAMYETNNLALLIGTDQEGGIVVRLPRNVSVTFPGNMAMAAAHLGHPEKQYATKIGKVIATNLKAVGINIDFAPDVDVNINPINPVINVRSFSDDPELVAHLGLLVTQSIQAEGVAATIKHFPGHGDTTTDSHIGLPVVHHNLDQAWQIDLYPFKNIIENDSPDLIMTAHIQFPALDNNQIYAGKINKEITVPATLSRIIQHDLLRNQLGYQGVIVTDALDMGAIAQNFDPTDATIKALQAGDDIALMPVAVYQPEDADKITDLISKIEAAVLNGEIPLDEIDQSVLRILKLKIKLGLLQINHTPLTEKIAYAQKVFTDQKQNELERAITDDAITLVQNSNQLIPIRLLPNIRIHILTPWLEQGAGIAVEITRLQVEDKLPQNIQVSFFKMADTDLETEKKYIDSADIVIVGNSTKQLLPLMNSKKFGFRMMPSLFSQPQGTLVFPDIPDGDSKGSSKSNHLKSTTENYLRDITKHVLAQRQNPLNDSEFAYQALYYAKNQGKKTIFISLLAPYDLPNYKDVSDAMFAGYDFYGYLTDDGNHGYYRGPSMPALTRIIFGFSNAQAKLPINVPNPIKPTEIIYPRGYGLTSGFD